MNYYGETNNTTEAIIPKGTIINGNIQISGKLEMYGEVNGDINSDSRVNVCGNVKGNIKANDLFTKDSFIEGQIECVQGAVVHENTVILGDINADSLVVDGAIQGKLDIKGCVTVGEKAIVDSDIKAKAIQVSNGAAINGFCSLCYADVKVKEVFPEETVKMPEKVEEKTSDADKSVKSKEPEDKKPEEPDKEKAEEPVRPAFMKGSKPKAIKRA